MSEWEETQLGEILELITDYHSNGSYEILKANVILLDEEDFAVMIRTTNFEQNNFSENLKYISKEAYFFLEKSVVFPGDIIMNKIANAGSVYFMPDLQRPVSLAMNLFLIRVNKEKANQRFVFYYLKVNEAYVKQFAEGSVTKTITKNAVKNLVIRTPSLEKQNEIVHIIKSVESKIENLRKQNKTLETIAQTLFKHWFVDFEFPNEDGKPYKSSGGEMERSELGEIPAGWFIEPLDEVANFLNGLALQNYPTKSDIFLPVIKIREMKAGITANTEKASLEIPSQYVIDNGDVIFSWSGSLEIIIWCFGKGALNQHLFKVSSTKYPKWFYYLWNLEHLNHFRAIAKSKATTMGHIQRKHLSEALCYVPDDSQLRIMDSTMSPILEKLIKNSLQIQTLTKTRDVLLPKLMSGKLRISE